jgi:hypothetical protein
MSDRRRGSTNADIVGVLEKQLIVTLRLAGVPQRSIREVLECDLNRVTRIVKHLKRSGGKGEG